jgi:hypothetical protein
VNDPAAGPSGPSDPREDAVCRELLSYLREHPRAMDTLEGIAGWWIPRHQIRIGVEIVAHALDTLTRGGLVERVPHGGRMLYRLRRPDHDAAPGELPPAGR